MSKSIGIRAFEPASASRALPWPVLEAGNMSYPRGEYRITVDYREIKDPRRAVSVTHAVTGAPLIDRWLGEGRLRFVVAVAAPISAYRALHVHGSAVQALNWDPDDIGSHPVFTPMVVTDVEIEHTVSAERDGLDPLWDGHLLRLPKCARVAIGPTFALKSGLLGLLDFGIDDELQRGQFRIEPSHEEGFKFKVRLASDLYAYLKEGRQREVGANIMTHIVSAALGILASQYREEEDWELHPNLQALATQLEGRGLPHWSEDTFDPAYTATVMHPHQLPIADVVEDG